LRLFENRVPRRIFGPKREGATGQCRELHIEELNDLYSSPSSVRVMKSRRIRWGRGGGSFSTYGGEERRIEGFGGET